MTTPTEDAYRKINESRGARMALAIAGRTMECRETFKRCLIRIVNELGIDDVDISSLYPNQWHYGAWRRLSPKDWRTNKELISSVSEPRAIDIILRMTKAGTLHNLLVEDTKPKPKKRIRKRRGESNQQYFARLTQLRDGGNLSSDVDMELQPGEYMADQDLSELELHVMAYYCGLTELQQYQIDIMNLLATRPTSEFTYKSNALVCKNTLMENNRMEIKIQTLINGTPLEDMSDSDLIHNITNLEDKIEKRSKIKTKSTKIEKEIAVMQKQCQQLAEFLDTRE